jgi:putative photosynthetic complex assembly protein 2
MHPQALAALFVLAFWWLSTAVILKLVWLGKSRVRFAVFSALTVVALVGLVRSAASTTPAAAYLAFSCALVVWGWHELSFLLGMITGPRTTPCPPGAMGWERFAAATAAVIHHEIALAATVALIVALTWGQPNQVGTGAFLVLWVMRLSAKLNLFLGVRNFTDKFVPQHLRYMLSYFRRARLNPLMPVSLLVATAMVVNLVRDSLAVDASTFLVVDRTLVATLLALAVIEHLFLVVPVPDSVLWSWAIRKSLRDQERRRSPRLHDLYVEAEAP